MYQGKSIAAILLMAGEGKRFGSGIPKQFHELGSKKIYLFAMETILGMGIFDEVILVCHKDWMVDHEGVRVIEGGESRQESSYRGVLAARGDVVLIHDSVRPFVSERILRENVEMAIQYGAVDTCIPSADTLVHAPGGKKIGNIPKREEFFRGQTPQTFRREWILEAHRKMRGMGASDDCQLVLGMGRDVWVVKGEERNMKITTDFDLAVAGGLLENV